MMPSVYPRMMKTQKQLHRGQLQSDSKDISTVMLKALRDDCTSYVLCWFGISLRDSWWDTWGSSDGRSYISEDYLSILQKDQLGRDDLVELQLMLSSLRRSSLQSLFFGGSCSVIFGMTDTSQSGYDYSFYLAEVWCSHLWWFIWEKLIHNFSS